MSLLPTPSEEDLEAVVAKDIYCKNKLKIDNIFNDPPPLFKTVADIQLDILETYVQVKLYLSTIAYIGFGLSDFMKLCIFIPFSLDLVKFEVFLYVSICLLNISYLFSLYSNFLGSCDGT